MKSLQFIGTFDLELLRAQLLERFPEWRSSNPEGSVVVEYFGWNILGDTLTLFVPDDADEAQINIVIQLHDPAAGKPIDWADIVAARKAFASLPNWTTWTAQEASDYVTNQIFSGWTEAQVESWINTNVTSLATAKTAMITMGKEMVQQREIVANMAEIIVYIRSILLRKSL